MGEHLEGEDLVWGEGGPRSSRYGDIYFSPEDGLAESRAVFLQGCGLPQAWAGRPRFTVAELGFGTGLNIAALLQLWRATTPPDARLSIFSVEGHLLTREAAARALACWPELAPEAQALLTAWPDGRRGFHRLDLPEHRATLDLYVGEVGEALARWRGPADAWFLDGFAPSRNPEMWRDEVLAAVGQLCAPGARVASFTVAGQVRRGLAAAGLAVEKRPGFGAKRERLEARAPGEPSAARSPASAVVVGGGIAGTALVRALHRQGLACTLLEAEALGAAASGNPAALVTPRFDAGFGPAAELHAQAFARAVQLIAAEAPEAVIARGALQLAPAPRVLDRFARLAAWDGFAPGALQLRDAEAARRTLDEPEAALAGALDIARAMVVEPSALLEAWAAPARRVRAHVARSERIEGGWRCLDARGAVVAEAEMIVLALGAATEALAPGLGLRAVRGQAEVCAEPVFSGAPAAWGAYAVPLRNGGVLFGASHGRGDLGVDLRAAETQANLAALAGLRPSLAERLARLSPGALQSRAATRAATPDHLPLAGELTPGLHILAGLGGRGFTLAPLLAEHVAAGIAGAPSPLSRDLAGRMRPNRFAENPAAR